MPAQKMSGKEISYKRNVHNLWNSDIERYEEKEKRNTEENGSPQEKSNEKNHGNETRMILETHLLKFWIKN